MGVLEDTIDEFKRAKPPEKVVIIGGSVAVLGIALYLHNRSQAQQPATGATPATASAPQGSQQSGWATVPQGSTPILPNGYQPIYDPNGNLVGYGPTPPGGGSPSPAPSPQPGGPPIGPPIPPPGPSGPLIPLGQYNGPNYSNLKPGTQYNYQGTSYFLQPGSNGLLWGTPVKGGSQVLLYGPPSAYQPKQGGGPFGTRVLGQRGKRIAPTVEGQSYVARIYARRPARS